MKHFAPVEVLKASTTSSSPVQITIPKEMQTYPMIFTIILPMTFYMEGNSCLNKISPCSVTYKNSLSNPKDLPLQTHKNFTFISKTCRPSLSLLFVSFLVSLRLKIVLPCLNAIHIYVVYICIRR